MAKYQGQIATWQDEKGFGFITPFSGGKQIFFHTRAWVGSKPSIMVGTQVKYDLSTDNKGRPCGVNVETVPLLLDGEPLEAVFVKWSPDGQLGLLSSEDHPKVKIVMPKSLLKAASLSAGQRIKGVLRLHPSGSWVLMQPTVLGAGVAQTGTEASQKREPVKKTVTAADKKPNSDLAWRENLSLSGVVTQWQDDKGFGFLQVDAGKPRVFLHISDYIEFEGRPENGMVVKFVLRAGDHGQWRAGSVQCVQKAPQKQRLQGKQSGKNRRHQETGSTIGIIVAALGGLAFLGALGMVSEVLLGWCVLMSVVSFTSYSSDKKAALRKTWRVSENRLHLQDLLGGWPGGWLARKVWHHKVSKRSFMVVFWLTVLINIAGLAWVWRQFGDLLPTFI